MSAVRAPARPQLDAASAAWLAALPCAVVTVLLVGLLGPPLGDVMPRASFGFWAVLEEVGFVHPEPLEQARYLLALLGPVLLVGLAALLVRRPPSWTGDPATRARAVALAQAAAVLLLVVCVVAQYRLDLSQVTSGTILRLRYFAPATLAVAALLVFGVVAVVRHDGLRARATELLRESPLRRWLALAAAVALTAVWLLHAVETDRSVEWAIEGVRGNLQFTLDEVFAIVNGRTPLVDFTAQYGSLLPSLAALPLLAFGPSLLVLTISMCTLTAVGLLAIFAVLRLVTRSSFAALALYLPFLATSGFLMGGSALARYTPFTYFGTFPLRYAGPFVLAWVTARALARPASARWPVFAAAGLVAINNLEFGVPAFAASVVALLLGSLPWASWHAPARLARAAVAGVVLAVLLVCALTLVRAGALPQLGRLFDYPRLYGVGGVGNSPVPGVLGMHVVVYLTYAAAIGTAAVRAARGARDRTLTGMLAWSGIFGLGSGSYWMGHSLPDTLVMTFSAWSLSLSLLAVVAIRAIARHPARRPTLVQLAVLLGCGVAACSLAQTPAPWSQLQRLNGTSRPAAGHSPVRTPWLPDPAQRDFFASSAWGGSQAYVKPGAPIAILTTTGHRIADAFGVSNVSRYTGLWSIPNQERLRAVVDDLRAAGGNTLLMTNEYDEANALLGAWGFGLMTTRGVRSSAELDADPALRPVTGSWFGQPVLKWVDLFNPRPAFLAGDRGELVATYR